MNGQSKGERVPAVGTAVGGVVRPMGKARVVGGVEEEAAVPDGKVGAGGTDDADFVSVLHVGTDSRRLLDDGDVMRLKFFAGSNTGELRICGVLNTPSEMMISRLAKKDSDPVTTLAAALGSAR